MECSILDMRLSFRKAKGAISMPTPATRNARPARQRGRNLDNVPAARRSGAQTNEDATLHASRGSRSEAVLERPHGCEQRGAIARRQPGNPRPDRRLELRAVGAQEWVRRLLVVDGARNRRLAGPAKRPAGGEIGLER